MIVTWLPWLRLPSYYGDCNQIVKVRICSRVVAIFVTNTATKLTTINKIKIN